MGEKIKEMFIIEQEIAENKVLKEHADYIDSLHNRIKELEERQKWINEVVRPDHPDDERPWCAAYLDCRASIKELEERVELAEATRDDALAYAKMFKEKVKELEEGIKRASHLLESPRIEWATKNAIAILYKLVEEKR